MKCNFLIKPAKIVMSDEKKVVHEIKLSKPVLVLVWFIAIGLVGKPAGNLLFPEAMAELTNYDTIHVVHRGSITTH